MAELLITGATGFVGSHVVEALARHGMRARALVRETSDVAWLVRHGIERVVGDVTDPDSLGRALGDVHVVIHLAAATRALDPATFQRVNAEGTRTLVAGLARGGGRRRLVYVSSLAAVGPSETPVGPDTEPRPITAYGRSKLEGERACLGRPELTTAVLRPSAVYGPRDRDLLAFFRLARWHVLPRVGPPGRRLQLIHAADLAEAIVLAAGAGVGGVFHVAEPVASRWDEVLDRLAAALGVRGVKVRVPDVVMRAAAAGAETVARLRRSAGILDRDKGSEVLAPGWLCETEGARRAFGFSAALELAAGLRETARWYEAYGWL